MGTHLKALLFALLALPVFAFDAMDFDEGWLASARAVNMPDGLVAWWKMDETSWSGTVGEVLDSSSYHNDGTAASLATTTNDVDRSSRVGLFEITAASRVDIPPHPSIKPVNAITVACWVKFLTMSSNTRFFSDWHQTLSDDRWLIYLADATHVVCYMCNENEYTYVTVSAEGIVPSQWYHFTATWDGSVVKLYTNGVYCSQSLLSGSMNVGSLNNVTIGKQHETGVSLDGKMDDAMIFNRALTESEIKSIYDLTNR